MKVSRGRNIQNPLRAKAFGYELLSILAGPGRAPKTRIAPRLRAPRGVPAGVRLSPLDLFPSPTRVCVGTDEEAAATSIEDMEE